MTVPDLINIGLSESGNDKLDELKERGIFGEKMDAYRFAVALAIAQGVIPPEISKRTTFLNVGSFDPDLTLKKTIEVLMPDQLGTTTVYRLVERLADWGVNELYSQVSVGEIDFVELLYQASVA
ncbi:MAG: hypothetical protein ACOVQZ_04655 [Candidatus Nanopelagicaceae bacterium]